MEKLITVLGLVILATLGLFYIFGVLSKSGKADGTLEDKLTSCPDSPNCVCSEYKNDTKHYIEPIQLSNPLPNDPYNILKKTAESMGGKLQQEGSHYLAYTFTSTIFRYVDDFEIKIDPNTKTIHLRSASRIGYSDAGVNKKRTEQFKKLFTEKLGRFVK